MENENIQQLKDEIEKIWNFHRTHNNGVMAVAEAKKIVDKLLVELGNVKSKS